MSKSKLSKANADALINFYNWMAVFNEKILEFGDGNNIFFRGVNNAEHNLVPKLGRNKFKITFKDEKNALFYFKTHAAKNVKDLTDWEIISVMRHHDIPTRLLDWTKSFSTALFFAIRNLEEDKDVAIWVINPSKLHAQNGLESEDVSSFSYMEKMTGMTFEKFPEHPKIKDGSLKVVFIAPPRLHDRISAQESYFSLHFDLTPLNEIYSNNECLLKLTLPKNLIFPARLYLTLNAITEFSLFPDLDGLGRFINSSYFRLGHYWEV